MASFESATGRGWWGSCEPPDARGQPDTGYAFPESKGLPCLEFQPLIVPIWQNASLNAPSSRNQSVPAWKDQDIGDPVDFNPEFVRLFRLLMEPVVHHMRAKGWINRTFAWVDDETPWPSYNSGLNFTVNAWVQVAKLFKSLDPAIRIQQTLSPASPTDPTWQAVEPLVDAWTLQDEQINGFSPQLPGIEARNAAALVSGIRGQLCVYTYTQLVHTLYTVGHRCLSSNCSTSLCLLETRAGVDCRCPP